MTRGFLSEMPDGLLKMGWKTWSRLGHDVRCLVVDLARAQDFKCALCSRAKDLYIDHDHYPEHGRGDKCAVFNVRGLLCSGCNWHVGMHEADERGDDRGWLRLSQIDQDMRLLDRNCQERTGS